MSGPATMMTALLAALLVLCAASLPVWPHSRAWSWSACVGIAIIALLVLALLLTHVV